MARTDDAARLRRELSDPRKLCDALALSKGAKRQRATGLLVLCPWHKERTPSCSVTVGEDGTIRAHCFGCQQNGDALSLIAQVRGYDLTTQFDRVLQDAAEIAGSEAPSTSVPSEAPRSTLDAASYHALAAHLIDLCAFTDEPEVLRYIEQRIMVVEGARAQLAGLPPPEKQGSVIARMLDVFEPEALVLAGLLKRDRSGQPDVSRFAFPAHRLVIPWRSLDGSFALLQRRRIDERVDQKYVFPPKTRPLYPFGAEELRAHDSSQVLTFVEGALDVLALRLLGRRNGLALLPLGLPGLDGWRPEWARFGQGRTVRIAFDADAAGERKVATVAADLYAAGAAKVERWIPDGKDWADLLERVACQSSEGQTG